VERGNPRVERRIHPPIFLRKVALFQKNDDIKIRITSRHEDLSEALRADIENKVHRAEKYLPGGFAQAHVILNYEKKSHVCEVNLTGGSVKFASKALSSDMYQSIEACFAKLMRQTAKAKDKRVSRNTKLPKALASIRHGLIPTADVGGEIDVIRSKKHAVKPMSVEEAAMQLNDSKDAFLVFLNAETNNTNVVYKRGDHHIGLIEPEH
jgi:putative sigma-54 modulation protein